MLTGSCAVRGMVAVCRLRWAVERQSGGFETGEQLLLIPDHPAADLQFRRACSAHARARINANSAVV